MKLSCSPCLSEPRRGFARDGARNFDPISPILVKLHWLPISYHVVFKLLLLVFKALNGLGPRYLFQLLQYQNHSRHFVQIPSNFFCNKNPLDYGTIFP